MPMLLNEGGRLLVGGCSLGELMPRMRNKG